MAAEGLDKQEVLLLLKAYARLTRNRLGGFPKQRDFR